MPNPPFFPKGGAVKGRKIYVHGEWRMTSNVVSSDHNACRRLAWGLTDESDEHVTGGQMPASRDQWCKIPGNLFLRENSREYSRKYSWENSRGFTRVFSQVSTRIFTWIYSREYFQVIFSLLGLSNGRIQWFFAFLHITSIEFGKFAKRK